MLSLKLSSKAGWRIPSRVYKTVGKSAKPKPDVWETSTTYHFLAASAPPYPPLLPPPRIPKLGEERLGPTAHHFSHENTLKRSSLSTSAAYPQRLITRASRRTFFSFLRCFQPGLLRFRFHAVPEGSLFHLPSFQLTFRYLLLHVCKRAEEKSSSVIPTEKTCRHVKPDFRVKEGGSGKAEQ